MKNDHDIGALLQRHTEQQLAGFDWDRLAGGITNRLAAGVRPKPRISYGRWAAVAAAIAVIAGIAALGLFMAGKPDTTDASAGRARVILLAATGPAGKAEVSLRPTEELGRCEVRLIESSRTQEERQGQSSVWIVAVHQPSVDDADAADVARLF